MAINKNHEFEDINGVKCAVVERNVSPSRVAFLTGLLNLNGYTVITAASPPPKTLPANVTAIPSVEPAESFTLGVTDTMFNATNAIFGRLLRDAGGEVVTLAYWLEQDAVSKPDTPYFER